MWDVDNDTDFSAAAGWIRAKDGVHRWLVAVKATFNISREGNVTLGEYQPDPTLIPLHRVGDCPSSLILDSDLLSERTGTDIILDACAFSPLGRPAEVVPVALRVGSNEKSLIVYGPRLYKGGIGGLTISAPQAFTIQEIHYEYAFGGSDFRDPDSSKHRMDSRNPVGRGVAGYERDLGDTLAHAVEYPGRDFAKSGPAGFGPIDCWWSPRKELAGTYDKDWELSKKPLLPDDFDPAFAMSAPRDQQCPIPLRGGENFLLTNLNPEGLLAFTLPYIQLRLRTWFGTRSIAHESHISAVIVCPHENRLSVVFQSAIDVPLRYTDYLDYTFIEQGQGG